MKLIKRKQYLNKLIDVMGTPDIKVITGIRRSGKSKLLEAFRDFIRSTKPSANIIHINFNMPEYQMLLNWSMLYETIKQQYNPNVENYVLIDEVQMCDGFEKAINGLHASELFDIYITGSNAFLMSSDLATLFTGRSYEINIFPFSFSEFIDYYELNAIESHSMNLAFDRYMIEGGMAGSYLYHKQSANIIKSN